jgi:hypothetical protein
MKNKEKSRKEKQPMAEQRQEIRWEVEEGIRSKMFERRGGKGGACQMLGKIGRKNVREGVERKAE